MPMQTPALAAPWGCERSLSMGRRGDVVENGNLEEVMRGIVTAITLRRQ